MFDLTDAKATQLADILNKYASKFGIDTKEKLQHFLAQAGVESANFTSSEENLNYQPSIVSDTFGDFFNPIGHNGANPNKKNLSELPTFIGPISGKTFINQESLFNIVYQDKDRINVGWSKLGNDEIGDGYKYIGRGFLQLTGKENYTLFNDWYQKNVDANLNFVTTPKLLSTDFEISVIASLWYFKYKVMMKMKTSIDSNTPSIKITPYINAKKLHQEDREKNFKKSKTTIKCN